MTTDSVTPGGSTRRTPSRAEMLDAIDQTLLKAQATPAEVETFCREAASYGFGHVCVNGIHVSRAHRTLMTTPTELCAVVGFPLGAMFSEAKAFEAARAVEQGAAEIDMVIDIGSLVAGDLDAVEADIRAVVSAAAPAGVKVIIETCYLSDDQKRQACALAEAAGAAYVKTSTGFGPAGATVEDVRLMSGAVRPRLGVKASGGIRDLAAATAMMEAGATRIGTSNGPAIIDALSAAR